MAIATHMIFNDASEQETALPSWQQRYIQISTGQYRGRNDYLAVPGITITRERINAVVAQEVYAPSDLVVFSFTVDPQSSWRVDGRSFLGHQCFLARGGHERAECCIQGCDVVMVSIKADLLSWDTQAMPLLQTLSVSGLHHYREWLIGLLEANSGVGMFTQDEMLHLLPRIVIDQLSNLYHQSHSRKTLNGARSSSIFRSASRLALDSDAGPFSFAEIAQGIGVDIDVAHNAVREILGITASQWLVCQRLNGARRDLLRARSSGATVASVAVKWHFWHLGRFAASYRQMFGEVPSDTIRQ